MLGRVEEVDEGSIWAERGREKVVGWVGCWEGLMVLAEVSSKFLCGSGRKREEKMYI